MQCWDIRLGYFIEKKPFRGQVHAEYAEQPFGLAIEEGEQAHHEVGCDAGADFLVLDEGEITLPMFVEALVKGETKGIIRATEKPDVTTTPIPRYDLLELDAYDSMSVQFSRGCPFQCEFCDIIVLYGRKPRMIHLMPILNRWACNLGLTPPAVTARQWAALLGITQQALTQLCMV